VSGALAFSSRPGSPITLKRSAQATSSEHDHSCCPDAHSRSLPLLFVTPAFATMPCGDEHACCAKHGPQNPPSLPAATWPSRVGSEGVPVTIAGQHFDGRTLTTVQATGSSPFQSYSVRSAVLRI
jgi:hypothetical protein